MDWPQWLYTSRRNAEEARTKRLEELDRIADMHARIAELEGLLRRIRGNFFVMDRRREGSESRQNIVTFGDDAMAAFDEAGDLIERTDKATRD